MTVQFRFADGRTAAATCSMWSSSVLHVGARITGESGEIRVLNLAGPHVYHRLVVRPKGGPKKVEHLTRRPTYTFQLEAFLAAVRQGVVPPTDTADAIANMTVIDDVYRAAGLEPRQPTQ